MDRTIGVLGAAGYTGHLVADELERRGLSYRLAVRRYDHLDDTNRDTVIVDIRDTRRLRAFVEQVDVLINTAGPFSSHGRSVIDAAVAAHTHYVDCSGERPFLADVLSRYAAAPVGVVVACGFQAVPGDCAAAIAVGDVDAEPEHLSVHYSARMLPSRGTARTLVSELAELATWPPATTSVTSRGARRGVTMPLAERTILTRRHPGACVTTTVALPFPRLVARLTPWAMSRLRRPMAYLADRLPSGPPAVLRRRDRATVYVTARNASSTSTVSVELRDTYGLTARFLVEAALRIERAGAMSPAEAFGGAAFLDAVSGEDPLGSLSWSRERGGAR